MKQYYKVWFSNGRERTAALVVDAASWPIGQTFVATYSHLFPLSEFRKMVRLHIGPVFPTFEEAFRSEAKEQTK